MTIDLLIVEDRIDEAILAQRDAYVAGFRNFVATTNLSDAMSYLSQNPSHIVSDLFFPAGELQTVSYSNRFLPLYEKLEAYKFPVYGDEVECVRRAVQAGAELFEVTPEQYVEEIMTQQNSGERLINAARDALHGRKDYVKYLAFQKIKADIANGTNLPLGIIIAEEAKARNIPCAIVTSTYHHDDAFEPISGIIPVRCFDTLVEGRKDWTAGINFLKSGGN